MSARKVRGVPVASHHISFDAIRLNETTQREIPGRTDVANLERGEFRGGLWPGASVRKLDKPELVAGLKQERVRRYDLRTRSGAPSSKCGPVLARAKESKAGSVPIADVGWRIGK